MIPTPQLLAYLWEHRDDDVRTLALSRHHEGLTDLKIALNALQARQKLQHKWPDWAKCPDVFLPESVMVEQSSSPETALYKTRFLQPGTTLLDLSGGMGGDSYTFSLHSQEVHYLEASPERAAIAQHNFRALHRTNITCHTGQAELEGVALASQLQPHLIYIDPDRRATAKGRTFLLSESSPDITTLIPQLQEASPHSQLLIKLSPMADITYLTQALPYSFDLHIVSLRREAKELLLHLYPQAHGLITAVELQPYHCLSYTTDPTLPDTLPPISSEVGCYLHDLFPAFAKVGYPQLHLPYPVWQPAPDTHLYFTHQPIADFPGRCFRVLESNKGEKRWLRKVTQQPLHLITKNLPITTDKLRHKWHIDEGGQLFLIAYGTEQGKSAYLLAEPIDPLDIPFF